MKRSKRRHVPSQTQTWQEARDDDGLASVITFEGIDLHERAALEVENFARAVKTPEKEDPGGTAMPITVEGNFGRREVVVQGITPMTGVRLGLGVLFAFVGAMVGNMDLSKNSPAVLYEVPILMFLFLFGCFLPSIVAHIRARRAGPRVRPTTYAFRLGLSPTQLVVEREGFRLALETGEIERFEGGERLTVLRRNGAPLVLPCSMKSYSHAPLAERLNEILRERRGYRG